LRQGLDFIKREASKTSDKPILDRVKINVSVPSGAETLVKTRIKFWPYGIGALDTFQEGVLRAPWGRGEPKGGGRPRASLPSLLLPQVRYAPACTECGKELPENRAFLD